MRRIILFSLVMVVAFGANACVSKSKYTQALEEADAARADFERTQAQKAAVEQQVKTLKELNAKLSQEAQLAQDELQRIEHSRDKERGSLAGRTQEMEKQIRSLVAQHQAMRKKYQDLLRHNRTLKSMVARYQKELKERPGSPGAVTAPGLPKPRAGSPKPISTPKAPAPPTAIKAPSTTSAARTAGPTPVNMNTASANDMVLFLGLSKEEAQRVVSNRPYRIKGELVAKNVIPKATFDSIRDRITVKP